MAKTQLEVIAEKLRTQEVVINRYSEKNGYGITSKNALSDGDELGKGQVGDTGTVGSLTDINTRIQIMATNKYSGENGYGVTNPNAMSDVAAHWLAVPQGGPRTVVACVGKDNDKQA